MGGLTLLFRLGHPIFHNDWAWGWLVLHDAGSRTRRHLGGPFFSTQGTLFSELFPAKVRYTGLSVGYQVAAAIAGFGPLIWTAMAESYGPSPLAFGGFMMAGLAIFPGALYIITAF
ncbi:hypothetical protein RCO48_37905 [Peribacillus frigoritolerans]|nr:hypothetical protein [Peribacillus frigoritolerans]